MEVVSAGMMELIQETRIGVIYLRKYKGRYDCRFEMESSWVGFSLYKVVQSDEYVDPELVQEWWFRFKFWAHVIDTLRFPWMAQVAKVFL